MPETVRCRVRGCKKTIRGEDFSDIMAKLRRHRKKYHPALFRKSVKKGVTTRKARA